MSPVICVVAPLGPSPKLLWFCRVPSCYAPYAYQSRAERFLRQARVHGAGAGAVAAPPARDGAADAREIACRADAVPARRQSPGRRARQRVTPPSPLPAVDSRAPLYAVAFLRQYSISSDVAGHSLGGPQPAILDGMCYLLIWPCFGLDVVVVRPRDLPRHSIYRSFDRGACLFIPAPLSLPPSTPPFSRP